MPYLSTAVALAIGLCLLDLVLTLGVIRRLREHTELLSRRTADDTEFEPVMMGPGERPEDFTAVTMDGSMITSNAEHGLIAFLSPGCKLCHEQLPDFMEYARRFPGGRGATIAVVVGEGPQAEELAARVESVARVVIEAHGGALSTAFKVRGYPAYAILDDGAVQASGYGLDQLRPALAVA
jgi:hypothetical protein